MSYSIVSGNDLRQFAIGDKSGVITVIRKLDREDLTRYQLVSLCSRIVQRLYALSTSRRFKRVRI